jgi:hypothetical protein
VREWENWWGWDEEAREVLEVKMRSIFVELRSRFNANFGGFWTIEFMFFML